MDKYLLQAKITDKKTKMDKSPNQNYLKMLKAITLNMKNLIKIIKTYKFLNYLKKIINKFYLINRDCQKLEGWEIVNKNL